MGCPCRNKAKEAITSANLPQGDPMASQRAYDANHTQDQPQPAEPVTASAAR